MNIEKIKNYNQKLLAVFGTLAVIFLAGSMLVTLIVFIVDIWPSGRDANDGLLSDEQTAALLQDNKRQQVVSYGMPHLIDTVNRIYVVPAAVQTLKMPETTALMDMSVSKFSRQERMYYSSANFINLLIYNAATNQIDRLFSQRVLIGVYQPVYFSDDILLLFLYADKDTDNNGTINMDDYVSLGVYSIKTKQLHEISLENQTVRGYSFIEGSKDLLIVAGVDKNKDGKYQESSEHSLVMRYDYLTRKLTDVVPQAVREGLQKLTEGRNAE